MSIHALQWAIYQAPTINPTEKVILNILADHADADGRNAWPSRDTIARHAQVSVATVKRQLAAMKSRGLITEGDHRLVSHIPAGRRPKVWNLNLAATREGVQNEPPANSENTAKTEKSQVRSEKPSSKTPTHEKVGAQFEPPQGAPVSPQGAHSYDPRGGSLVSREGGHSYDPQTVQEPSKNRPTPYSPPGDNPDAPGETALAIIDAEPTDTPPAAKPANYPDAFERFWAAYPKKIGKRAAFRAWKTATGGKHPIVDPDTLVTAAAAYAHTRAGQDPRYTKHPQGWLTAGRWDDNLADVAPTTGNTALALLRAEGGMR